MAKNATATAKATTATAKAKTNPNRKDQTTTNAKTESTTTFETLKRTFEQAHASGNDYTTPLYDLATAIAYSVVNKCIDPQRKTAATRETVSDSGYNPAMIELKRGIGHDLRTLEQTRYYADVATRTT